MAQEWLPMDGSYDEIGWFLVHDGDEYLPPLVARWRFSGPRRWLDVSGHPDLTNFDFTIWHSLPACPVEERDTGQLALFEAAA